MTRTEQEHFTRLKSWLNKRYAYKKKERYVCMKMAFFVLLFIYFCRELDLQENYISQSIGSIEFINKHLGTPKTSSRPRVILFIVEIQAERRQLNGSFFSLMAVGGGEKQATNQL